MPVRKSGANIQPQKETHPDDLEDDNMIYKFV